MSINNVIQLRLRTDFDASEPSSENRVEARLEANQDLINDTSAGINKLFDAFETTILKTGELIALSSDLQSKSAMLTEAAAILELLAKARQTADAILQPNSLKSSST